GVGTGGQRGDRSAPAAEQRARRPAPGAAVTGQGVQELHVGGAEHRLGPALALRPIQSPGGPVRGLAGPATPERPDRLLTAAIGAGPQRVLPAEQAAGPAQPAGQPGHVPTVTAGASGLVSPGVAGAAASGPQPRHLLAALGAGPRFGGPPPLAPFAPVPPVDRAQLTAAGAGDQPGQRQPVAAGAQPRGHVPAGPAPPPTPRRPRPW